MDGRGSGAARAAQGPALRQEWRKNISISSPRCKSLRESIRRLPLLGGAHARCGRIRQRVRFASEDVGLADPQALPQALAGWQSYQRLGSPEGEVALAQADLIAPAPRASRSAHGEVKRTIEERPADPVRPRCATRRPPRMMKELGYGREAPGFPGGSPVSSVAGIDPGRDLLLARRARVLRPSLPAGVRRAREAARKRQPSR